MIYRVKVSPFDLSLKSETFIFGYAILLGAYFSIVKIPFYFAKQSIKWYCIPVILTLLNWTLCEYEIER